MCAGDTLVLTVAKEPHRCPPGPYVRACVVADDLERRGCTGARVVVLDANPGIQAVPEAFTHAFNETQRGVIQCVPNAVVTRTDSANRSIDTTELSLRGARVLQPDHVADRVVAFGGIRLP